MEETSDSKGSTPATQRTSLPFVLLLLSTQLAAALAFTVPIPVLAQMAGDFAADPGAAFKVKMISGILGPSMAIGAPLGGWLASKFNRRGLLVAFGLLATVGGIAPVLLSDLNAILAARSCLGLAASALMALGFTMPGDYMPQDRQAKIFGLLSATSMVASVISLPLSGVLGDDGWRVSFLLYLAPLIIVVLALPHSLPPPVRAEVARNDEPNWLASMPWGVLTQAFVIGLILAVPGVYLSFHLTQIGVAQASTIGLVMSGSTIVSALASVAYGATVGRIGQRLVFVAAFATMGIGMAGLGVATNVATAVLSLIVSGIGMGWLVPNLMAAITNRVGDAVRGRIVGIAQSAMTIAPLVGLSLLEPMLPTIGTKGVLLAIGILSAFYAAFFALSSDRARQPA